MILFCLNVGEDDDILFTSDDKCFFGNDSIHVKTESCNKAKNPVVAQIAMIPQTYVELNDEQAVKDLHRTLDLLDEDDDVTDVWTNWDE